MILRYGTFTHKLDEVALSIKRTSKLDASGAIESIVQTWDLTGFLTADTQALLTIEIQRIEAAYEVSGKDITLFLDDGLTLSAHFMVNGLALGGLRVISGPSFPEGAGVEYTTTRRFTVVIEGEFLPPPGFRKKFLAFSETLTFTGGGPRFVMLGAINGPPQRQQTAQQTAFKLVQSGTQTGHLRRFRENLPLFPADEHFDLRQITESGPDRRAGGATPFFTGFVTSWQYTFEAIKPFNAIPTFWIE